MIIDVRPEDFLSYDFEFVHVPEGRPSLTTGAAGHSVRHHLLFLIFLLFEHLELLDYLLEA